MARNRTLAIIQAGGAGGRMDVLTDERAKPALPFAGVFQLLDFPMSNLVHSGIDDVWLSVQYQASTLDEQVGNGRPWDLDRNRGGFRLLMPQEGTGTLDEEGFSRGNADELFRIRDQIAAARPEVVIVLSADHVYRFDYTAALQTHHARKAECTLVTTEVSLAEAGAHATVEFDHEGRVTGFAYKPERPSTGTVASEIFIYDPAVLVTVLEELHRERSGESEPGDSGLGDFGDSLVPRMVQRARTFVHALPGYWRDLGQPHLYLAAHQDILTDDQDLFGDPDWPIVTGQPQRVPGRVLGGGVVEDSLISPGARVFGTVRRSVLGPGAVVEKGALVENSVVFADTVVASDATVHWTILDTRCRVESGARVSGPGAEGTSDPDQVTIVGKDSRVGAGAVVPTGARLAPGTTV